MRPPENKRCVNRLPGENVGGNINTGMSMTMNTGRLIAAAAGGLSLISIAACTTMGGPQSSTHRFADGTRLELLSTLEFPGRSTRVYIQDGETVRRRNVNEWAPYCSFGLNRKRDGQSLAREIPPGAFTIRRTSVGVEIASGAGDSGDPGRGIRVAGLFGNGGPGGTPWPYRYTTKMELYSEQSPQLDDLTCAVKGAPPDRNLTREDIRRVLDGIARIDG